jgi:acyl-CoA thioesterase-1
MDTSELFSIASRFSAACALALWALAAPAATILVYGDSLSAGYGLPSDKAWPTLLGDRLREEGFANYKVANASISGETTLGGKNRIATSLREHRPDIVILALGANDGLRGASLADMRSNLEALVDASRKSGARVLLVGMRLPPNYGKAYTEKFEKVYREVAAGRKVPLVPFMLEGFAEKRAYFLSDTVHPSATAQPLIRDTVWKGLRPLLGKSGR